MKGEDDENEGRLHFGEGQASTCRWILEYTPAVTAADDIPGAVAMRSL